MIERPYHQDKHEILEGTKAYQQAYDICLFSRGIKPDVIQAIRSNDCKVVLEAESDYVNGWIEPTPEVWNLIIRTYFDVPQDQLYIQKITFENNLISIENAIEYSDEESWYEDDDYILNPHNPSSLIYTKEMVFNLWNGTYAIGSRYQHELDYYIQENVYQESTVWSPRRLPQEVVKDFVPFLNQVDERVNSRIAVYKDLPESLR